MLIFYCAHVRITTDFVTLAISDTLFITCLSYSMVSLYGWVLDKIPLYVVMLPDLVAFVIWIH